MDGWGLRWDNEEQKYGFEPPLGVTKVTLAMTLSTISGRIGSVWPTAGLALLLSCWSYQGLLAQAILSASSTLHPFWNKCNNVSFRFLAIAISSRVFGFTEQLKKSMKTNHGTFVLSVHPHLPNLTTL